MIELVDDLLRAVVSVEESGEIFFYFFFLVLVGGFGVHNEVCFFSNLFTVNEKCR